MFFRKALEQEAFRNTRRDKLIRNQDWRIDWIKPRPTTEFLVHLRPGYVKFSTHELREKLRLQLQLEIIRELREQANWLLRNIGCLSH